MTSDRSPRVATLGRVLTRARATAGTVLADRYRLERLIGTGGMGEVWEARHLLLDRVVAVKLLAPELRSQAERLLSEARTLARISHPAIVQVYDCGVLADGTPLLVMERLHGQTLGAAIARAPFAQGPAVQLFLPVLDGLAAAHGSGVIHRDLKPDNIFLVDDGAGGLAPRVLDFGIALVGAEPEVTQTSFGMGTPSYMSPEQFRGERADPRTDVWGASATLYETLVGVPPFGCDNLVSVMQRVLEAPVPFPRTGTQLDGKLWAVVARGLRKEATQRFPSIAAMRDELASWLMTRSGGRDLPPAPQATRPHAPRERPTGPDAASAGGPTVPAATPAARPTLDDVIRKKLTPGGKP